MARRSLPGRLLVLEGPDGVGKSTFAHALGEHIKSNGQDTLELSFPGKVPGSLGELVYRVHHDEASLRVANISLLAKQALHVAAHIDAIDRQILPALKRGQTVLLDRFWWSAWVYGVVGGCDRRQLRALIDAERAAWGTVRPTLAIVLRRPEPIHRPDNMAYWRRLAAEYGRLASRESRVHPVSVIDNVRDQATTLASLIAAVEPYTGTSPRQKQLATAPPRDLVSRRATNGPSPIFPLKPTVVYDTYWRFAAERQEVFFRRVSAEPQPWTADPILREYKFTNVYRASDRVSQYLIRHVIYGEGRPTSLDEVFFRIMLFKLFNKIETWVALERALGALTYEDYTFTRYDRVLTNAMAKGNAIYSAAYIMPSGGELGHPRKHQNHLALLERMLGDSVAQRLSECRSMQRAFELLKSYPSLGDFLAYQFVIDINYSEITNFSESGFVVPGPGALDGIRKCFQDRGGLNEPETIKFMMDRQEKEFDRLGLTFRSLWGRRLQLIDCQNLFCEVDKYSRVAHPEVKGLSGRLRIKQRFTPRTSKIQPWYPPKWGINEAIERTRAANALLRAQLL